MKKILILLIAVSSFSCENSLDFEGRWECINDSSKFCVFEKINQNTYQMKWEKDDRVITGTIDENGNFTFGGGFLYSINTKTNQLIPDKNWTYCGGNFRKVN